MATLHEGFAKAQATCAALGLRPIEIEHGCWWIAPWVQRGKWKLNCLRTRKRRTLVIFIIPMIILIQPKTMQVVQVQIVHQRMLTSMKNQVLMHPV